jgi:hypothetical protein
MEERGPLEQELFDLIRRRALSDPDFLELQVAESPEIPTDQAARMAVRMGPTWMEAILRLAREIDELRERER